MQRPALALVALLLCSAGAEDLTLRADNGAAVPAARGTIADGYATYPHETDRAVTVFGRDCELTWRSFDVEASDGCSYDYVEVKAWGGASVGTYCGSALPATQVVRGEGFTVLLHADEAAAGAGFELEYVCSKAGTLPPTPVNTPGSRLATFSWRKTQRSAGSKHWRREHWNAQLVELSDVVMDVAANTWYRSHTTRTTLAHETCHAIDNDLESRGARPCRTTTSRRKTGFYLTNYEAACVTSPSRFNKDAVKQYIPAALRWGRYDLYLERINKGGDPMLVLGEWTCYIVDGETAYELYTEGLLIEQGNLRHLKSGHESEARTLDHGFGAVEFLIYSYAVGLAAEDLEPAYLESAEGRQFLELVAVFTRRTWESYCRLKPVMELGRAGPFRTAQFFTGYEQFRTSAAARPFRAFGARHFGRAWFDALMNCEAEATPAPPTPAPVPGVAHLRLADDDGRTVVATSGTITDGYGTYPADADRAVTVVGDACLLTFTALDLEPEKSCGYDWVEVRGAGGVSVAKFCGAAVPAPVRVNGDRFTVILHSDGAVQRAGFDLLYVCGGPTPVPATPIPTTPTPTAVPRTPEPTTPTPAPTVPPTAPPASLPKTLLNLRTDVGRTVTATAGTIADGWKAYPATTDRAVTVRGEGCAVRFTSMDVEYEAACGFDYVQILDADGVPVGRFCGDTLPTEDVRIAGDRFTVALHSDEAVQGEGFVLAFACNGATLPPAATPVPTPPAAVSERVQCGGYLTLAPGDSDVACELSRGYDVAVSRVELWVETPGVLCGNPSIRFELGDAERALSAQKDSWVRADVDVAFKAGGTMAVRVTNANRLRCVVDVWVRLTFAAVV